MIKKLEHVFYDFKIEHKQVIENKKSVGHNYPTRIVILELLLTEEPVSAVISF